MYALQQILSYIEMLSAYFTLTLGRCALLSLPVLFLVLLLRNTICKIKVFARGALWSLFLIVPFLGKLHAFYDNLLVFRLTWWWQELTYQYRAVRLGYMGIVLFLFAVILLRRIKLWRWVSKLRVTYVAGVRVAISDERISPFTTGLFRPGIVLPRAVLDDFDEGELSMILLHERTHVKLGHLWIFFLWEALGALLWINPLLRLSAPLLKEDMERICDAVTIRRANSTPQIYGNLLLKSMRLLNARPMAAPAAFTGEESFTQAKRRILGVLACHTYDRKRIAMLAVCSVVTLAGLFTAVRSASYPAYTPQKSITLVTTSLSTVYIDESEPMLHAAFSYDGDTVTIVRPIFDELLKKYSFTEREFYIYFDGYMKLPGIGGGGSLVYVDYLAHCGRFSLPYEAGGDLLDALFQRI